MSQQLYVTFPTTDDAENAVGALLDAGVRKQDMTIIVDKVDYITDEHPAENMKSLEVAGVRRSSSEHAGNSTATGAGIGLGVGILAGLATLMVPGVGLIYGAGALAASAGAVAATAAAGTVAGGLAGYLKDKGIPESSVRNYAESVRSGGALVELTLPSDNVDSITAMEVVSRYGGTNAEVY